jgi:carbon-monoxide dehydrogenase medium subunit
MYTDLVVLDYDGSYNRVAAFVRAGQMGAYRWTEAEDSLTKNFSLAALEKMQADQSVMNSDIHGDAEYRAHLVEIMTRRAVAESIAD